jgi:hypothetical protein
MAGPLDDCILFMPTQKGQEGAYSILNRPYGWAPCDPRQSAFLHANRNQHVPAGKLRRFHDEDDGTEWGGLAAFGIFVVGGMVIGRPRLCSNCALPGHDVRTCELDEAPILVDPEEDPQVLAS